MVGDLTVVKSRAVLTCDGIKGRTPGVWNSPAQNLSSAGMCWCLVHASLWSLTTISTN